MNGKRKETFAPVFYKRHCTHVLWASLKMILFLVAVGSLSVVSTRAYFETGRFPFLAAFLVAALLFFLYAAIRGFRDMFRVRLLPYFSKRLNDAETFLAGEALLRNSRHLDEIANRLALRPLSHFASGDDLVLGEKLSWHDPQLALEMLARLEECPEALVFSAELKSDLRVLQEALASARRQEAKFCLVLREGSYASGAEMDRRKGSFF